MTWDDYCAQFVRVNSAPKFEEEARQRFDEVVSQITPAISQKTASLSQEDVEWLIQALNDEQRKWFVVFVLKNIQMPEPLFGPMIRAAVYERDPSDNRRFIDPCLHTFGHRKVNEALLNLFKSGSNFEKAGAARALYWAQVGLLYRGTDNYEKRIATPESQAAYDALSDIRFQEQCLFLQEFVVNDDLHVRRSLIPRLVLDPGRYPEEMRPLVNQAIEIARSHPDDYIRHRVEIQLGTKRSAESAPPLLKPMPPRE